MRRRILLLVILAGTGLALSLWHGQPQVAGAELLRALEARKGPMRGALMLMDYAPDPQELAAARLIGLQRGEGSLPGQGLAPATGQRWAVVSDVEFVWRMSPSPPLRAAIAEDGPARIPMLDSLTTAGYYQQAAQDALQTAAATLDPLNDEDLFLAWLRADRAIMAQSDDPARATREGLLLAARRNAGPAILFASGHQQVYLLPIDGPPRRDSSATWVQMEAYEAHRLKWTGTLRLGGSPEPRRVRTIAALMAQIAGSDQ